MADFAPTGQPRSIAAPLDGPSNPAVYVLPQGVAFDLQAVYVDIDASGAGATTATLTIRDSSGAVIAKKRQGETVNAGAIGSATWALRLDDAAAAAAPVAAAVYAFGTLPTPAPQPNNIFQAITTVASAGVTVGPTTWTIQTAGRYFVTLSVLVQNNAAMPAGALMGMDLVSTTPNMSSDLSWRAPVAVLATTAWEVTGSITVGGIAAAGQTIRVRSRTSAVAYQPMGGFLQLLKIA